MRTNSSAPRGASSFHVAEANRAIAMLGNLAVRFEYKFYNLCSDAADTVENLLAKRDAKGAAATGWTLVRQIRKDALPLYLEVIEEEINDLGEDVAPFRSRFFNAQLLLSGGTDALFDGGFRSLMALRSEVYKFGVSLRAKQKTQTLRGGRYSGKRRLISALLR